MTFPVFSRRLILLVATVAAACVSPAQGDTWWALRAGRDIWHEHRVSLTDHYSYTAAGDRWPDHEWLWQVLLYGLHQLGGMGLISLAVGLMAGGALALTTAAGAVRRTDLLVLLCVVPGVVAGWSLRPQVLSMLLFALILWLLRNRRWWWCVPLMLLWANAHGGVVFGGLALAAACIAGLWHQARELRHDVRQGVRPVLPLLAVTALGALATLATPLGAGLWRYVLTSGSRPFEQRITEWQPAYAHLTFYTGTFWVWVAGTAVAVVVRRRRLRTWPAKLGLVSTLAVLPLSIDASRNMSMFVLAAAPLLVQLLRRERTAVRGADTVPLARSVLAAGALIGAVVTSLVYLDAPSGLGWHPMARPIARAVEACPGHVYTSYDSGAYLIWFTPPVKVFVDNRQDPYSERILDLSVLAPDTPYVPTFRRYDIRCAALLTWGKRAIATLRRDGWSTAAHDDAWVVLTAPGTTLP